jgi:hexosaminidase
MAACSSGPRPAPTPAPTQETAIPAVIPAASKIATCKGPPLAITPTMRVSGPREIASQLEGWLGLQASAIGEPAEIELRLLAPDTDDPALEVPSIEKQSFTLTVDGKRAVVTSSGRAGLFYGAQTIAQLAGTRDIGGEAKSPPSEARSVPCVTIEDRPRSRFRVMHLDVARHFFDRATVERYVDLLSFYRFNVFHWHLVDDQGFRLQLWKHPELASPDASYSQAEVTSVVGKARERFVTVVPEIEMPGHSRAILAAHPELSCTGEHHNTPHSWGIFEDVLCVGNPASLTLVQEILTEVARLFPAHYVHVGGDEVPGTRWNACPKCQAAMKAAKVDAAGLEHLFLEKVYAHLATLHRRPMAWDEALPEKPGENAPIIVAWQSKARGDLAAARGFDTIYAPYDQVYFNFRQSAVRGIEPGHDSAQVSLETVRAFDPGTGPHVLGGEGALWTEYATKPEDLDTLAMPRLAALGDALWSGPRPTADFVPRFSAPAQLAMLDRSQVSYFVDPPRGVRGRRVVVEERYAAYEPPPLFRQGVIRYTRDGSTPIASSPRYRDPLQITDTTTIATRLFLPSGRTSPAVTTTFVKEEPRPARSEAPRLRCEYWEGVFHRLSHVHGPPKATVDVDTIAIAAVQKAAASEAKEHFAFRCTGGIEIPETGVYRFVLTSDDGAQLSIDHEPLVDLDGEHEPKEDDGEIALAKGLHDIEVFYFQSTEGKDLRLEMQRTGAAPEPLRFYGRLGSPSSTLP